MKENSSITESKLDLLMKQIHEFYLDENYIKTIQSIVDQTNVLSLRILDWFITNYSKKYRTIIKNKSDSLDVYMHYKLMLKAYGKFNFDPFCRKNKILFYYGQTDDQCMETSCGQLTFFKWCFENNILDFVKNNLKVIKDDMEKSLIDKKLSPDSSKKRKLLSLPATRSISKQYVVYKIKFD